jgi:hypothetical protein
MLDQSKKIRNNTLNLLDANIESLKIRLQKLDVL